MGRLFGGGKQNTKRAPLSGRAVHLNAALVRADDSGNGREAQAASGEFGSEKRIENLALRIRFHAAAGVSDFQVNRALVEPRSDRDGSRIFADGLGGIADQVEDDLLQLV